MNIVVSSCERRPQPCYGAFAAVALAWLRSILLPKQFPLFREANHHSVWRELDQTLSQ
jgi:hypothetical protein